MANITLALDDDLLTASRAYAERHQVALNALVRSLLETTVRPSSAAWVDECFARLDAAGGDSRGLTWQRDQIRPPAGAAVRR
ncbi:MAG: hypothetical protein H0V44_16805 [Planctomycetes bacterium]|nr:hypothetical protein [Planctomycetota bacterium]